MYNLIKEYKNLNSKNINGKILYIEKQVHRTVLIQYYPINLESVFHHANLNKQQNLTEISNNESTFNKYFPINQKYFILKSFFLEMEYEQDEFIQKFKKKNVNENLIEFVKIPLINDQINFEKNI
jgi:hypothetical protein